MTFTERDCDQFAEELKQRVAAFFEEHRLSRHATVGMVVKTLVLLAALFVPFGLILAGGLPGPLVLALCLVMGLAMAGIGFGIAHDANHGAYSANPRVNAGLGLVFDLLGANGYMWRITHNVIHHTYTNIHGVDEDLEVSPLLRLSPHSPHRWFHRFQHLYAPFAYSMSTLNWVYWKDFDYFRRRRLGPYQDRRHPRGHVALLVGAKLLYYGWSVVLPLLVLDFSWWQILIGYLIVHLSGGLVLGVVFQLAHVVEQASQPLPDDLGRMPNGWLVHEMVTTANFSTRNRLLTWYVGGLNHQVEHHLFPRTCSVHYPRISGIVREVASKHGVPYHSNPTLWSAIRSHWRMLRQLGRPMEALPSAA